MIHICVYIHIFIYTWAFPGGSAVQNPSANAGDAGSIPGWKVPLEKEIATYSSTLVREIREQRSLVGYSPQGHKSWKRLRD